jgi:YggT family protein
LVDIVDNLFTLFIVCILVRILMSWIPMSPLSRGGRAIVDFFRDTTEWYLRFFRRFIPMAGPIDLSPMVAVLVVIVVQRFVVSALSGLV